MNMARSNFKKITVRAIEEKYDEITIAMKDKGFKSRSKYLVWTHEQCEGKDVVPAMSARTPDDEIFFALNRVGHNINQLTTRVNVFAQRGYMVAHHTYTELTDSLDELEVVLRELRKRL